MFFSEFSIRAPSATTSDKGTRRNKSEEEQRTFFIQWRIIGLTWQTNCSEWIEQQTAFYDYFYANFKYHGSEEHFELI